MEKENKKLKRIGRSKDTAIHKTGKARKAKIKRSAERRSFKAKKVVRKKAVQKKSKNKKMSKKASAFPRKGKLVRRGDMKGKGKGKGNHFLIF